MINELLGSMSGMPKPEVGMGATRLSYSDRHACTIVWVHPAGKQLRVLNDIAKRIDNNGMSESQEYEFTPREFTSSPIATGTLYKLRKNGRWVEAGFDMYGPSLLIGKREEYYDFSF